MKYVVKKPIAYGGRKEVGEEVELSEADAQNIGVPEYLVPANAVVEDTEVEEVEKPLAEMTVAELRDVAEAEGLAKGGTKAELLERITLARENPVEQENEEADDTEE